jgi:hypothetical protein
MGALYTNSTGTSNTAVGVNALYNATTGSNNIALGQNALIKNTTGSNNIVICSSSDSSSVPKITTQSGCIVIGNNDTSIDYSESPWMTLGSSTNYVLLPGLVGAPVPNPGVTGVPGQMIYGNGYLYICNSVGNWFQSKEFTNIS